jgi:UDP-GlcNAc3NAcA epimerase
MKLITIIGARPQFVKAAILSRAIASHKDISEVIIHTGQHFDHNMSDVFFTQLVIPKPQYNLDIHGGTHGMMTGRMLEKIEAVFESEKPDMALVFGDTNSTLAGALAARKNNIPLAHVEAGLRSFNMKMPEEINRILTDRISDLLFCPTTQAIENLNKEGFENFNCQIIKSGDVMLDAALYYSGKPGASTQILKDLKLSKYVLCTIHRAENTDSTDKLQSIIDALSLIANDLQVLLPLHPRTRKIIKEKFINTDKIKIIDPVGYFEMIQLIKGSELVLTDSGGVQKEAFFFKKNCVTLREETEWTELVENGFNVVAGSDTNDIVKAFHKMINHKPDFSIDLYGKGNACDIIVENLISRSKL